MTVVILAVVGPLVLVVGLGLWLRSLKEAGLREVRVLVPEPRLLEPAANFFGIESKGLGQVRGNGCLALSDSEVVFVMWAPRRTLRFPRGQIVNVDTPRSHLGKTRGGQLLKITWQGGPQGQDSVAFSVRELETWVRALGS